MTAIHGFTETLLGGALGDSRNNRKFLEIILEHALRLERLTNDLTKLSLIEAGKLHLDLRPVAIPEVVNSCIETVELQAHAKQLALN